MSAGYGTRWGMVLAAVGGGIVAALHVGKVSPALPFIRADLGLDLVAGGFVVSMFNLLGMVLALAVGVTADRLGRRRLVAAGFVALALGGLLGALADGLGLLLLGRFIEGIGFIGVAVAAPALVMAAAAPHDRSLALALWSVFMPAGMALALLAAPPVLAVAGWRGLWLGGAGLAVAALVAFSLATARAPLAAAMTRQPWRLAVETLARPGLLLLGLAFGSYAFQWVSLMVWLPTFLAADLGAATTTAALLTALVVAVNVPSNIMGGWLLRQGVPRRRLIVVASAVMAVAGWGIFTPALGDVPRYALCLAFSFAAGFVPASLFAGAPLHAPSPGHMAAANGILMQGSNLGQFIGPPLVAAAVAAAGGAWSGALLPLLGGALVTAVAGVAVGRLEPRGGGRGQRDGA